MDRLKVRSIAPGSKSDWQNLKEIDKTFLEALEIKDFDKVDKLIRRGANINVRFGEIKDSCMHFFDDLEILSKLLEFGASVSASNRYHESPLIYACKLGRHRDVINFLLRNGAYVNKQISCGRTKMIPLTLALQKMNNEIDLDIVEDLLYYGANMDVGKMFSSTPFITALRYRPEMARIMIKYSVLKVWDKYRFLRMGFVERRQLISMNYPKHLPFLEECMTEVERLKEEAFSTWHSVYDICRGAIYFQTYTEPFSSFQNSYKTKAFETKYPIYIDVILKRVDFILQKRRTLLMDLGDIKIVSKFKKNKECKRLVPLNYDCLRHVAQFLSNCDIERLVRAAQ